MKGASTEASAAIERAVQAARSHAAKKRSEYFPYGDETFERTHRELSGLADANWPPVRDRVASEVEAAIAAGSVAAATFWGRLLAALAKNDHFELRGDCADLVVRLARALVALPAGTEHLANAIYELLESVRHEARGQTRPPYGEVVLRAASCKQVADNLNLLFDAAADFLGPGAIAPLVGILDREIRIAVGQWAEGPDEARLTLEWLRSALAALASIDAPEAALPLGKVAERWPDDAVWLFAKQIVFPSYVRPAGRRKYLQERPRLRALVAAIPVAQARGAKAADALAEVRGLAGLSTTRARPRTSLPKVLPDDIEQTLALLGRLELTKDQLRLAAPATSAEIAAADARVACPAELREILRRANGVASAEARAVGGDGELAPAKKLAALQKELAREIRSHLEEDDEPVEKPDLDLRALGQLFAIGKSSGGDFFVLSSVARAPSGTAAVIRFVHDEALTCRVERASIAAFIAALALEAWNATACDARAAGLLARKTKVVLRPPAPAKAPRAERVKRG